MVRITSSSFSRRLAIALMSAALLAPSLVQAQDAGPSVETCIGCHAPGAQVPVANITSISDLHYVDTNPAGPATDSGYRQWNIVIGSVDVTGMQTIVDFHVEDENGSPVDNVFDTDGRLVIARLVPGPVPGVPDTSGDPSEWTRLVQERFTEGGSFQYLGSGDYRFTTLFDPTSVPIAAGDTLRAAIELGASDIPAGNGWCDFDASLVAANDCVSGTTVTRDIIRTATCNVCHGPTPDTKLAFHRNGSRTEVEYCVACHTPNRNPDTGFTTLVHKIHYGAELTQDWLDGDFSHVVFTKDIDDCTNCHAQGPVNADNWKTEPNREACGSCHDDVNFDTGENHGGGGQQPTNRFCTNCHPPEGAVTDSLLPVSSVHQGLARAAEGALYRGEGNGFAIESATFDRDAETLTIVFSVTRDGVKMNLLTDPEWTNNARLNLDIAWSTEDYTNEGSGRGPGQPFRVSGLDVGGVITDLNNGSYETVVDVSGFGFGTVAIGLEGYPRADLIGDGVYSAIPIRSAIHYVSLEARQPAHPRRDIVDIDKCSACHDSGGAGISLHGNNRTGEIQVCVLCHNPNATDIGRRPADPGTTPDGKREESVDFKRLIHAIHMGGDLEEPIVVYGFGGSIHDYASVEFIGNSRNCLTCHRPGTYGADDAWYTLPSTVDTGADVLDPSDDLNISPTAAVCSSCHDSERAEEHILATGGTFGSLDEQILLPAPEPAGMVLPATALGTLALLAGAGRRSRRRKDGR